MPLAAVAYPALLVALLQTLLGLVVPWVPRLGPSSGGAIPDVVFSAIILTFAGCSALLFFGGRKDRRAVCLAAAFLLAAAAFSARLIPPAEGTGFADWPIAVIKAIEVNAFLPFFVWVFAIEFPSGTHFGPARSTQLAAAKASAYVGALLVVANLVLFGAGSTSPGFARASPLGLLSRGEPRSLYWPMVLLLLLGAFLSVLWKARTADTDERRRIRWLVVGAAVGIAPVLIVTALDQVSSAFHAWISRPQGLRVVGALAYPAILAGPATMTYAVLVHRALEVRIVIRKAIQYALARQSVALIAAVPFVVMLVILVRNRNRTLAEIMTGTGAIALLITAGVGSAGLLLRRRLVRGIDRVFFREQYDARRILGELAERSRDAGSRNELAELIADEVGRALHPERCTLFVADSERRLSTAVGEDVRALSLDSMLVRRLTRTGRPFEVDWSDPDSAANWLPAHDANWLTDGHYSLLLPLIGSSNELIGLLALGEKRSELPYSQEDRTLLMAIAASAALVIENRLLLSRTAGGSSSGDRSWGPASAEPAKECLNCGALADPVAMACERCGGPLISSHVPLVVGGKYRVRERIGRGGMGVVYRAEDSDLGRAVAVKTLPEVSPRLTQRLRREARAMAAVSHPNLATVYSVESWLGTPMLVVEYLAGGTLADRLRKGPLAPAEVLRLGSVLAEATARIHAAGVLHRDIKPGNIGFTEDAVPKLLDFGLARMIEASFETGAAVLSLGGGAESRTTTGRVLGTMAYLSPEALEGREPSPGFDVWSVCVVLYEALAGVHPFRAGTPYLTAARIASCTFDDLRERMPEATPELSAFFREAFAPVPGDRPQTGVELGARMKQAFGTLVRSGMA